MAKSKSQPLSVLVEEGELSAEAAARLEKAWVTTCDELYARMKSCVFAENPDMERAMEQELGLKPGKMRDFMRYIERYVSPETVNAPKPPEYPFGARIPPRTPLTSS